MVALCLQLQLAVAEGLGKVSVQPVISSVADGHNFGGLHIKGSSSTSLYPGNPEDVSDGTLSFGVQSCTTIE